MASFVLQLYHDFGQSLEAHFIFNFILEILADLEILAVHASKIAVAKENVSRTVRSYKRRFFAEMRTVRAHNRKIARITPRDLASFAVAPAIERTDITRRKHLVENFYPSF
jgi:hypothetical protein